MALGNTILIQSEPHGTFLSGYVSGTPKPGTCMEVYPATEPIGNLFTYRVYQPGTDGERRPVIVLLEDENQGVGPTTAYTSGRLCRMYCPVPGEQLNMLMADVAGTGDDHAIGDVLMIDTGTGKLIVTTGSPESEAFICLETATDPAADALLRCMYTGH